MQLNTGVARKQKYGEITNMETSQEGIALIKKFEGCPTEDDMAVSYQCAAKKWTLGYGSLKLKNGTPVKEGMKITLQEAEDLLAHELKTYEKYVTTYVDVPLQQNQFDSLVSWTFNLGGNALATSTMLKVLNNGVYEEVPHQMKRWNKVSGKVSDGLIRRREAEALLFEGKEWHEI